MATDVHTGFYTAESLEMALLALQKRYDMDSATFLRAHRVDAPEVEHISGFLRHTWASYYLEWRELTGAEGPQVGALAGQIERELEHA